MGRREGLRDLPGGQRPEPGGRQLPGHVPGERRGDPEDLRPEPGAAVPGPGLARPHRGLQAERPGPHLHDDAPV